MASDGAAVLRLAFAYLRSWVPILVSAIIAHAVMVYPLTLKLHFPISPARFKFYLTSRAVSGMDPQTQPIVARISKLLTTCEHMLCQTLITELWIKWLEDLVTIADSLRYARIKGYSSIVECDDKGRGIGRESLDFPVKP